MKGPLLVSLVLAAAFSLAAVPLAAQVQPNPNYTPPRTPWGDPDIQGTFSSDDSARVPLERPEEFGDRLFLTDAEYADLVRREQERIGGLNEEFAPDDARIGTGPPSHWIEWGDEWSRQTSRVIDPPDGRIPALTPEGEARNADDGGESDSPASWEDFSLYIRCITRGLASSLNPTIYGNASRIVQAPGYVVIQTEMVHEARVVPLDGRPHVSDKIRMYMGNSVGHWEDDTLVVETRNMTDKTAAGRAVHSEDLVVTERFRRVAPDRVYYEATFDDPRTWTAPWTVGFPLVEKPGYELFEYACHEGNNSMFNMLSGARADEAAAAEANDQ